MKGFKTVLKILAFLAAIGAAVYVGITYRDKIVAWVKRVLKIDIPTEEVCCCGEDCCCDEDCCCEEGCCGEDCCCEEEAPAPEYAVEAEEKDFEG